MLPFKDLLHAFTPIFLFQLLNRSPTIANLSIVTNVVISPIIIDVNGTSSFIITTTTRPMQITSNGKVSLGSPQTTTIAPPLIYSVASSAAFSASSDQTLTLNANGLEDGSMVTIGSFVFSAGDVVVTSSETATINYYANDLAPGVYTMTWSNPDGGTGMAQLTFN